jgi:hypothetical protein
MTQPNRRQRTRRRLRERRVNIPFIVGTLFLSLSRSKNNKVSSDNQSSTARVELARRLLEYVPFRMMVVVPRFMFAISPAGQESATRIKNILDGGSIKQERIHSRKRVSVFHANEPWVAHRPILRTGQTWTWPSPRPIKHQVPPYGAPHRLPFGSFES